MSKTETRKDANLAQTTELITGSQIEYSEASTKPLQDLESNLHAQGYTCAEYAWYLLKHRHFPLSRMKLFKYIASERLLVGFKRYKKQVKEALERDLELTKTYLTVECDFGILPAIQILNDLCPEDNLLKLEVMLKYPKYFLHTEIDTWFQHHSQSLELEQCCVPEVREVFKLSTSYLNGDCT